MQTKNPFLMICDKKVDAEIMHIKSVLIILLMKKLNTMSSKRKDMASILGCSESEMSKLANGYLSCVTIEKIIKHLSTIGFSVDCNFSSDADSAGFIVNEKIKAK